MSTTRYIVNNVTGQTITGDLTVNGNFNVTGETNTRPYKVYTALLTQNGSESDPQSVIYDGLPPVSPTKNIGQGVSYYINANSGGDFTQFGAPNNQVGTYFVANTSAEYYPEGSPWTLDYNNGSPNTFILENSLGDIVYWTYEGIGTYFARSVSPLFTESGKVYISCQLWGDDGITPKFAIGRWIDQYTIEIDVVDLSGNNTNLIGDQNLGAGRFLTSVEIRVYN